MPEHTSGGRLPHLKTTPPPEVMDEIAHHNTSLNRLLEDAALMLDQMDGDETAAARLFVERGFSDAFANWLPEEAKARAATLDTSTAGTDGHSG